MDHEQLQKFLGYLNVGLRISCHESKLVTGKKKSDLMLTREEMSQKESTKITGTFSLWVVRYILATKYDAFLVSSFMLVY